MIPIRLFNLFEREICRIRGFIFIFITFIIFILIFKFTVIAGTVEDQGERELKADSISTSFLEDGGIEEFTAEGNALMVYDNYRIMSDFINYKMQTEDIFIKGNITFDYDEYKLYSDEMNGNLGTMEFRAAGGVQLKNDNGLDVSSRELLVQDNTQTMTFTENVVFKYKDIEAVADTATYYSEKEIVLLEGNVTGERGDLKLSGQKLEINLKDEKMKLLGKAELLFDNEGEE